MSAIIFAIFAPASIFLLSFGLLGAGRAAWHLRHQLHSELPHRAMMREFMAFTMVTMMPAAPFGNIYGWISDHLARTTNCTATR